MKRYTPALAFTLLLTLAGLAIAQTGAVPGLTQPILVTVTQAVPADITLAIPQDDGAVLTVTAPITVGVNLQITIDGAHVVAVEAAEATPPIVVVEELAPASKDPWDSVPAIVATPSQERSTGGLVMAVQRVGIFDASAADHVPDIDGLLGLDAFRDATAIGFLQVSITNTTDSKLQFSPTDGVIVIGSEQINLRDYRATNTNIGGEIYPGVNKQGAIIFAVKNTPWDEIASGASGYLDAGQPSDSAYNRVGDAPLEFTFEMTPRSR